MNRALAQALAADPDDAAPVLAAAGQTAAAAELQAGQPLAQVLATRRLVPETYLAAFENDAPEAVQPLAEAAERFEDRRRVVRNTTRAALVSGALAWAVMMGATEWVLPSFFQQFVQCGAALPAVLKSGIVVFSHLASPAGLICTLVIFVTLAFGADMLWRLSPGGRRARRIQQMRSLAILMGAGIEMPVALRRIGGRGAARLAQTIDGGTPAGDALTRAGWVPRRHQALLDAAGPGLAAVLGAIATTMEAEDTARAAHAGRWIWVGYALVIGGLATLFACTIMIGSVTVTQCLG